MDNTCSTMSEADWLSPDKAVSAIKSLIRAVPDFPQKGILFRDIMPLFQVPRAVTAIVDLMFNYIKENHACVEAIVGLDARGFLIGPMIAIRLNIPFIPIRKQGKLPGPCHSVSSTKEYGSDVQQMQKDALRTGQQVVVVDDLLATGGTLKASEELVEVCGAKVLGSLCLIELVDLKGRERLKHPFHAFLAY